MKIIVNCSPSTYSDQLSQWLHDSWHHLFYSISIWRSTALIHRSIKYARLKRKIYFCHFTDKNNNMTRNAFLSYLKYSLQKYPPQPNALSAGICTQMIFMSALNVINRSLVRSDFIAGYKLAPSGGHGAPR